MDDIKIHPRENDLILGTHGRSIWIVDDITPLEQLSDEVLVSDAHLFDIRPGVEWHMMDAKTAIGHAFFIADNPPYGAIVNYYLKASAGRGAGLKIDILDKDGSLVRALANVPRGDAGLNLSCMGSADRRAITNRSAGGGPGRWRRRPRGVGAAAYLCLPVSTRCG